MSNKARKTAQCCVKMTGRKCLKKGQIKVMIYGSSGRNKTSSMDTAAEGCQLPREGKCLTTSDELPEYSWNLKGNFSLALGPMNQGVTMAIFIFSS